MHSSSKTKLHIISSDVPFPANYGGMIDVFYTIKQLAECGIEIYLHCFQYGRAQSEELGKYCVEVHYYKRKTGLKGASLTLPYMLYSRRDEQLLSNLLRIDAPILFEGVHCCYLLHHNALAGRKKIVRNQNVEQQYYYLLAQRERNLIKKAYYLIESFLLRKFESKLSIATALLPISTNDTIFFAELYPTMKVEYVQGFHPYNEVISSTGRGTYCLYHGNLAHAENIEAALFLIQKVFDDLGIPLILAGRQPHQSIQEACRGKESIKLIANPGDAKMKELIAGAQIHVLPTFQASGLKLKLIYALYAGRFVLVNDTMLYGTELQDVCVLAQTNLEFKKNILKLMQIDFSESDIEGRKALLNQENSNVNKAKKIIKLIQ